MAPARSAPPTHRATRVDRGDRPEPGDVASSCAPLGQAAIGAQEAEQVARRLKALADPSRLRLLSLLLTAPDGEVCTCDLTEPLGLAQPTVTHHLKKLADAGLVTGERRGTSTFYRAQADALEQVAGLLRPAAH
jgi:ArsR family transcriptional regulator, arsenate/arsenite/antimonite-responsive transcriptional repressor